MPEHLNVIIARDLMGWRHWKMKSERVYFLNPNAQGSEHIKSEFLEEVSSGDEGNAPRYDGSIALAWTVAEKLMSDGWTITLAPRQFETYLEDRVKFHGVRFVSVEGSQKMHSFSAHAETVPLAICYGALDSLRSCVP